MKKILVVLVLVIELFADLPQSLIDDFNIKKATLPSIEERFRKFESLSKDEQSSLISEIYKLVPNKLLKEYINKTDGSSYEFAKLYAPLINYKAYMLIDKYNLDNRSLKLGIALAKMINEVYPTNIAYQDTYLWGIFHKGGNLDFLLNNYPNILKASNYDKEVKYHFDMVKKEALKYAIENKDLKLLQKLYDLGMDFNIKIAPNNRYAIFNALYSNDREDVAKFLIEHGVKIDSQTSTGATILLNAVINKFSGEFILYLLEKGADKNYFNDNIYSTVGNSPYFYAKNYRNDIYSKKLIKKLKPDSFDNYKLAFMYQKLKYYDELYEFVQNYNNVDDFQKENKSNLLENLLKDYKYEKELNKPIVLDTIKLLIQKGMSLDKLSYVEDKTIITYIFSNLSYYPNDFLEFLFDQGIDINEKYFIKQRKTHWIPIFAIVPMGDIELFRSFIKKGADINYVDEDGLDLFYLTIFYDQLDMAKELIKAGYKPTLEPKGKRHPLAMAVMNNNIEAIEFLISLGYDPKKSVLNRDNLLYFALYSPNKDLQRPIHLRKTITAKTYKYLIDMFKDSLNDEKEYGYHNLILSKEGKDAFEAFEYLVKNGVDLNKNNYGYSPIEFIAIDEFYGKKLKVLLEKGFKIDHQNKDGATPLHNLVSDYSSILKNLNSASVKPYLEFYDKKEDRANAGIYKQAKIDRKSIYIEAHKHQLIQIKDAIKLLIQNGAKKDIKHKLYNKSTPYELAISLEIKDKEILDMLKGN